MKIKCVKTEKCPICGEAGSCQVFFNKQGKIRYGRVRHCILKGEEDFNPNVKYNFRYCKIEDLDALKTLLLNKGISLSTDNANSGQTGQWSTAEIRDLELKGSSLNSKSKWAGSSARIEHHPPKVGVVGSNPTPPAPQLNPPYSLTDFSWTEESVFEPPNPFRCFL
jgi:hypothetical protein